MKNRTESLYGDVSEAVVFVLNFEYMIYSYGSVGWADVEKYVCSKCGKTEQYADFLAPKSNCKKEYAILDSYEYDFSEQIRNGLIENFDITEDDFHPVRNKKEI